MNARAEILARITRALSDNPPKPPNPQGYARELPNSVDLVALFAERAAEYRATVTRTDEAALPGAIAHAAGDLRLAVPADLPAAWITGVETVGDDPPLGTDELNSIGGVLTSAAVAIALTGTVILDAGPGQGRRVLSLLPDRHICVIRTGQIVGTVAEALRRLNPTRPQTWISGPSATSDIELNRVEGVHGPRQLHLLIVS